MLDWLLPTAVMLAAGIAAGSWLRAHRRRDAAEPRAAAAGMDGCFTEPATRDDFADALARIRDHRPSPPPAEPATPVLDRAVFDDQRATFGDERLRRFLSLLRQELDRRRSALDAAALDGDRAGLAVHAHAIASAAGNLGFVVLLGVGRRLEGEFPELAEPLIPVTLDELRDAIDDALALMDNLDAELAGDHHGRRAAG